MIPADLSIRTRLCKYPLAQYACMRLVRHNRCMWMYVCARMCMCEGKVQHYLWPAVAAAAQQKQTHTHMILVTEVHTAITVKQRGGTFFDIQIPTLVEDFSPHFTYVYI